MAAALQRGPVGRDVDPRAVGALIESGPDGAEADLDELASRDDVVIQIEERLSFVDLRLGAGVMRLGFGAGSDDPIVLAVSARVEQEAAGD